MGKKKVTLWKQDIQKLCDHGSHLEFPTLPSIWVNYGIAFQEEKCGNIHNTKQEENVGSSFLYMELDSDWDK